MRTKLKAVALTAAALLNGCASGGGGQNPIAEFVCFTNPLCLASRNQGGPSTNGSGGGASTFTNWANHRQERIEVSGPDTTVRYEKAADGSIRAISTPTSTGLGVSVVGYGANGVLGSFRKGDTHFYETSGGWTSLNGQAGIDVAPSYTNLSGDVGLFANPHRLGWSYQSFGAWNSQGPAAGALSAASFGRITPASAVAATGTATFAGKLAGFHVTPAGETVMAAADLSVNANFSTRSLTLTSSGTTTSQVYGNSNAAPYLNLTGALRYSPTSNSFTGTLTNGGGTMSGSTIGRYYGPAAQELGGVFTIKSPTTVETFSGAYGAKR